MDAIVGRGGVRRVKLTFADREMEFVDRDRAVRQIEVLVEMCYKLGGLGWARALLELPDRL